MAPVISSRLHCSHPISDLSVVCHSKGTIFLPPLGFPPTDNGGRKGGSLIIISRSNDNPGTRHFQTSIIYKPSQLCTYTSWMTSICSYLYSIYKWSQPISFQPTVDHDVIISMIQFIEFISVPKLWGVF